MAGIKIHQYPLERTSIGDEDYYDIDYWTGSSYQTAKIKGSTLKNVLGANYIDITAFISGYELTDKDAGKLITNSNANVRTLVIPSGLALPNNMITVKGRIAIQPETGVNITLPDGSTITDPSQFTCIADEVYILHKSAFSGDDYILVAVKKSENIGTNDLIITDTIRELQVAENGTFQIVTNDANNSAIFRVGENSNERFSEIEFNTVIFDLLSKFQNPAITAGVIVEVNPNEFKFIVLPDTSNTSVYHGLISANANKTIIEKSNAGKLLLDSSLSANTFEDLRATKKGLEYSADYSANFSVRSLVDKGYVDSGLNAKQDTLVSGVNIRTINGQTLLGSTDIVINSENIYTNSGTVGTGRVATLTDTLSFSGGRVSFDTTTNGILLPRLTTAQMNAVVSPATNLLVYNTDLNGLYRYNGSAWVALVSPYGGKRYTLIKPNGTQQYYDTLVQVRSDWADGDVLHQFGDETVDWVLNASDSMFILPAINWNGNGFKITMQNFTSSTTIGFLISSKTVNIFDLNFDVDINANNTYLVRCIGTGVLNLNNVKGVQINSTGFGSVTYMLETQNTAVINGDKGTFFSSLSPIVISGANATCNAYKGTATSFINGVTFVNFRLAETLRGENLNINVSRLFGSCLIQNSKFNQVATVTGTNTALEGASSGNFIFDNCEITYNSSDTFTSGTFSTITYNGCKIKNTTPSIGLFYNLINSQMDWIGNASTISANISIINSYINSSGSREQIRMNGGSLTVRNSVSIHNDATANNVNFLWLPGVTIDIQDSCLINLNNGGNLRGSGLNSGWSNTYFNRGENAFIGADGYTNQQLRDANKYRLNHSQDFCGNTGIGLVSPYPAMTTPERDALTNVRKGYTIENTTTNFLQVYNGSTWKDLLDLT